jgi:hypothetical protein
MNASALQIYGSWSGFSESSPIADDSKVRQVAPLWYSANAVKCIRDFQNPTRLTRLRSDYGRVESKALAQYNWRMLENLLDNTPGIRIECESAGRLCSRLPGTQALTTHGGTS